MGATRGVEGIVSALFPELFEQLDMIDLYGRMNGVADWSRIAPASEDARVDVAQTLLGELCASLQEEVDCGNDEYDSALIRVESYRTGGMV